MVFRSSHYVDDFWKEKFQSSLEGIAKAMQAHTYKAKRLRPLAKDMSIEHIRELLAKFPDGPKTFKRDVDGGLLDYDLMPDMQDVLCATHKLISQKLCQFSLSCVSVLLPHVFSYDATITDSHLKGKPRETYENARRACNIANLTR